MAYATLKDAKDLYGENYVLTSVDRDLNGEVDFASFVKALNSASSEADSYLAIVYDVPVAPTPKVLADKVIDMAIYKASADASVLTDEKRRRYEDAIKWLLNVSKGLVTLGLPTDEEPTGAAQLPEISVGDRLFTREKLGGLL